MAKAVEVQRATYDAPEIARMLGINKIAVYQLMRQKGFPCIQIGRRLVVPREAFHQWMKQAAEGGGP